MRKNPQLFVWNHKMQAKLAIGHLHDEDASSFWMGND